MIQSKRFINHPLLSNKRSRAILTWFLLASLVMWGGLWMKLQMVLKVAGIDLHGLPVDGNKFYALLISPVFHLGVSVLSAILASGLTARLIVGPINRIQDWLLDWEAGYRIGPLKPRRDEYENVIKLINDLYDKHQQ